MVFWDIEYAIWIDLQDYYVHVMWNANIEIDKKNILCYGFITQGQCLL